MQPNEVMQLNKPVTLKDVAHGKLPLTVAFAEIARIDPRASATLYNTYTTTSGVNDNVGDDGVVGDKD